MELSIDFIGLGLLSVGLGFLQVVLDKGQREDWFESHFIVVVRRRVGDRVGRGLDLGTHAQRSHRGLPAAERPEFLPRHPDHVHAGVRPLRQHRLASHFPSDPAGIHGAAERAGAFAGGNHGGHHAAHRGQAAALDSRRAGWWFSGCVDRGRSRCFTWQRSTWTSIFARR